MKISKLEINPVAFKIANIEIRWYALVIVFGMCLALALLIYNAKNRGISVDEVLTIFLIAIPTGAIGARLGYVIPRPEYYPLNSWQKIREFFSFRSGGLTIVTGVLVGFIFVFIYLMYKKKSVFRITDIMVPSLLLAQVVGRWGNFFNSELYGLEIKHNFLKFFPMGVKIDGTWHYASFFYESFLNFIALVFFMYILYKYINRYNTENMTREDKILLILDRGKIKTGVITFSYFSWYTLLRGLLEFIKYEALSTKNGVKMMQVVMLTLAPIFRIIAILIQADVIKLESNRRKCSHFGIDSNIFTLDNNYDYENRENIKIVEN